MVRLKSRNGICPSLPSDIILCMFGASYLNTNIDEYMLLFLMHSTHQFYTFYVVINEFFLSCSCYSPSGKLVQIEYALSAVAAGAPSVGIKAANGVVIATEKKHKSVLYDEHSVHKVELITKNIGMVYSGMGPDYRYVVLI